MTAPIARIEPLQILRGIAAILILAKHALYEVDLISPIPFNYGIYEHYTVGIDIFFVLSGFIMIYISWGQSGFAASKNFILRRVLRIVPTYWFYTLLLVGVSLLIPQVLGKVEFVPMDVVKSLLFIPYYNPAGDLQPFLANGWSLNYEMYFYVIFAACLLLPARLSLIALTLYFAASVGTDFWGVGGITAHFYGDPIVLEFLAGALIGFLFVKNVRLPHFVFYIGVLFVICAITALFYTQTLLDMGVEYNKPLVGILSVLLLSLPKKSENLKMPKWAVFIGDSSYTLYLAHPFAIGAVTQAVLLAGLEGTLHPWLIFTLICLTAIIGSGIAYVIIEKPLLSFTKGLVYKKNRKINNESAPSHEKV